MNKDDSPHMTSMKLLASGGIAGCLSWASVFPLDVVKTKYQVQNMSISDVRQPLLHPPAPNTPTYTNVTQCFRETWAKGGMVEFWRGFNVTMVRAFIGTPGSA